MDNDNLMKYYNYFSNRNYKEDYYNGNDLGAVWSKKNTQFCLWAPTASKVTLNLYESGDKDDLLGHFHMLKSNNGTWKLSINRDLNHIYYTYSVTVDNETMETVDPYAIAAGVNGNRGMVLNLSETDPKDFSMDRSPAFEKPTDAVIYEIHVRDFSMDKNSGMTHNGKYLAFTETGTTNSYGAKTGVDHLMELGITHVHLMPVYDFATIDETNLSKPQFNWGYDPQNYNIPEGSYATDPYHGEIRIKEFKQMVQSLHSNGIRIIMDVVYNHTFHIYNSNFQKCVPGYYYRMTPKGNYSNASGCGNETASERAMMRKYIIDSVVYWAKEYHIDGFRFDLMGCHDIKTMNKIREALNQIDPGIIMYGEGWTGGNSTLPFEVRAIKSNMSKLNMHIAAFCDELRDGIKGSVFERTENGFISGRKGMEETIKYGIVAATHHTQVDYWKVNYSRSPWAVEPTQTINYTSSHDNLTLWDKITLSAPDYSMEEKIRMNLLSAAIILTSQGIPFFQAGEEFLRSKPLNETNSRFEHNSYISPDSLNSLKWNRKSDYMEIFSYYRGLIAFRKKHYELRCTVSSKLQNELKFLEGLCEGLVGYVIHFSQKDANDSSETDCFTCILFNSNREEQTAAIPEGVWNVYVKGNRAGTQILDVIHESLVKIEPISAMILCTQ
jgi:pullulanase